MKTHFYFRMPKGALDVASSYAGYSETGSKLRHLGLLLRRPLLCSFALTISPLDVGINLCAS